MLGMQHVVIHRPNHRLRSRITNLVTLLIQGQNTDKMRGLQRRDLLNVKIKLNEKAELISQCYDIKKHIIICIECLRLAC